MPTFPSFDLSSFDVSKLELPKLDWSKFELPKVDFAKFELPRFDLAKFDLPDVDVPEIDVDRVVTFVRDVAYAGVGLAVLAVEQADKARRDFDGVVRERVASLRNAA